MRRATLHSDLVRLFKRKRAAIATLRAIGPLLDDALFGAAADSAFLARMTAVAEHLPAALRDVGPHGPLRWPPAKLPHFLRGQHLISLVAELEGLFVDLMREVVIAFPHKLSKSVPDVPSIADTITRSELVEQLAEADANRVMYLKPSDYRARIEELLSLPPKILGPDWDIFVEAKARRDLALHNQWQRNRIYDRKAGARAAKSSFGGFLFPTVTYFEEVIAAADRLVQAIENHVAAQFAKCTRAHVFEDMWRFSGLQHVVDFADAWTIVSPEMVRPVDGFSWAWSGSEELLFAFFVHIYNERDAAVDFPRIYSRWSGRTIAIIDEWLNYPFSF